VSRREMICSFAETGPSVAMIFVRRKTDGSLQWSGGLQPVDVQTAG
jgi:hypothetical protein